MMPHTSLLPNRLATTIPVALIPGIIFALVLGFAAGTAQAADISVVGSWTQVTAVTAANPDKELVAAGSGQAVHFAVLFDQVYRGKRVTNMTAPTAVELLFFDGAWEEGGIRLTWITGREEALGFHLWRSEDGQRPHAQRITPSLIPAVGGVTGATYQFLDTSAQTDIRYTYWLQEVTSTGSADDLGKITVGLPGEENQIFLPLVSN